jgi:outer membrane protein assembly factor BamB
MVRLPRLCTAHISHDDNSRSAMQDSKMESCIRKIPVKGRVLALLMACVLTVSMTPGMAFADEADVDVQANADSEVVDVDAAAPAADDEAGSLDEQGSAGEQNAVVEESASAEGMEEATQKSVDELETALDGKSRAVDADQPDAGQVAAEAGEEGKELQPGTDEESVVSVEASIVGSDANGNAEIWAAKDAYELSTGSTAEDLTKAIFERAGLTADYSTAEYGFYLNTITSPFDGRVLGWDETTGRFWQLFVNGEAASTGASEIKLSDGDAITWAYSAFGAPAPTPSIHATCAIYGPDADDVTVAWAPEATFEVEPGATGADLTRQAIEGANLTADIQDTQYGFYLNTITSPFDGRVLGWDETTGKFWQLFVNGEAASTGASGVVLEDGDAVTWSYSVWGDPAPEPEPDPVPDPDPDSNSDPDPNLDSGSSAPESEWPSFTSGNKNGAVVKGANTPTDSAEKAWEYDPFDGQENPGGFIMRGLSDPLLIDGDVFVIGGSDIYRLDAGTGKVKLQASTGLPDQFYFSRPAYAGGVIYAAANDGRVAAFDASTLERIWCTDALPVPGPGQKYQSLSSIVVNDGKVYAFFTVPEKIGTRVCLDAETGNELWRETEEAADGASAGYYWAGACISGADLMIADDTGAIKLIDSNTGKVKATYDLGSGSRSGVIALDDVKENGDGTYLAVTREDGTLHKIVRKGTKLTEAGKVEFAETSTSTPAVSDGKVFVCGSDKKFNGTLSVIDLKTMKVEKTVAADKGSAQGSPLVSVRSDGTYVYFTCNNATGGVYAYKLGTDEAYMLYEPAKESQNYCTASVIADSAGNLYYANDTHKLVKLLGEKSGGDDPGNGGGEDNPGGNGNNNPGSSENTNQGGNGSTNSKDSGAVGNQGGSTGNKSGNDSGGTSNASSGKRSSGAMMSINSNAGSTRRSGLGSSGSAMSVNSNTNGSKKAANADGGSKDKKENGELGSDSKTQASQAGNVPAHGAVGSAQATDANRTLPFWPIVGAALSALAIATLLAALYRRSGFKEV